MSDYIYLKAEDGSIFYFDAVIDTSLSMSGSPTKYTVSSRAAVSDHYTQEHLQITITGVVSDVKFGRNSLGRIGLEDFSRGIKALKESGVPFTVSTTRYLDPFHNCLFTSLQISNSVVTGEHSADISMTIVSIGLSEVGDLAETKIPFQVWNDTIQPPVQASGSTSTVAKSQQNPLGATVNQLVAPLGFAPIFKTGAP